MSARLAASAMVLALLAVACQGTAEFQEASFDEVEQALLDEGIQICEQVDLELTEREGVLESRELALADESCRDDERRVDVLSIVEFETEDDRDGALRDFQGARGRIEGFGAQGVAWTFGPFVIFLTGERNAPLVDRVTDAMENLGAK